jgi:hypothetical protein
MTEQTGKIALRREGTWWVAYWARLDPTYTAGRTLPDGTAEAVPVEGTGDKVELCRVRMNLAEKDAAVKAAFIDLAKLIMTNGIAAVGGSIDYWNEPVTAPEVERSRGA